MADTIVTRDGGQFPNYSGMLFRRGNARTPFSTLIGAQPLTTNHVEFPVGVFFTAAVGTQPEISEQASLTAPDAIATSRTQETNVTQIFQQKVNVSYAKQSDMGTMSGLNIAGQTPNPSDELDFQIARAMEQIAADIEYTFINGTYQKATGVAVANKTRGILEAITKNVTSAGAAGSGSTTPGALTYWKVAEALSLIHEQGGDTSNIVLGVSAPALLQLNKDASENQYLQGVVNIAGLDLQSVVTPLGRVVVTLLDSLNPKSDAASNTAILFNPAEMHPVYQPTSKGNFFLEPLAKTGASDAFQIFGQAGLDYGDQYHCAKITDISNDLPTGTL